MSNIITDIEQSKKLIKLGIDESTADMFWLLEADGIPRLHLITEDLHNYESLENYPAWSLSALLNLLPHTDMDGIELNNYSGDRKVWTALFHWKNMNTQIKIANNPLDAVFKVVCWFLENKEIINDTK